MAAPDHGLARVPVWDLPVRLFHWTLGVTLRVSAVSAKLGGHAMLWHLRAGHLVIALGGHQARCCGGGPQGGDESAMRDQFGKMGKRRNGCHDEYRKKP